MAIKPILFNGHMVDAILDGRKTVTRRVVEPQPVSKLAYCMAGYKHGTWSYPSDDVWKDWGDAYKRDTPIPENERSRNWTPPCHTDDVLWVREPWNYGCFDSFFDSIDRELDNIRRFEPLPLPIGYDLNTAPSNIVYEGYVYRADGCAYVTEKEKGELVPMTWRLPIHMPRDAARIWLRVTNVRVEPLHGMHEEDVRREGFENPGDFIRLWDSTIKPADCGRYGWEANPWVWVIEFERCEKPEQ